jgi:hypothetical protein
MYVVYGNAEVGEDSINYRRIKRKVKSHLKHGRILTSTDKNLHNKSRDFWNLMGVGPHPGPLPTPDMIIDDLNGFAAEFGL